jgi:hypothetical protein
MTFDLTAIEWIAVVMAVVGIIKILVILVNKKAWFENVVVPIYSRMAVTSVVFLVLAGVVFYYLLQTLDIVTIFAVMAFTALFMGAGLVSYSKDIGAFVKKIYKQKFSGWLWLYILIWLALSVWVLWEVFKV